MALFQRVDKLRERLGYADTESTNAALLGALQDTKLALEAKLRTQFSRVTVVDEFLVTSQNYGRSQLSRLIKLDLSRGLVDTAETVNVYAAATRAGLDQSGSRIDLKNVDTGLNPSGVDQTILEDAERGRMIVTDYAANAQWIRVTYTAGLVAEGGDPALYTNQPEWLTWLANIQAELNALSNPLLNPGVQQDSNRRSFETPRVTELRRSMEDGLHEHVCIGPGYNKPVKKAWTAV